MSVLLTYAIPLRGAPWLLVSHRPTVRILAPEEDGVSPPLRISLHVLSLDARLIYDLLEIAGICGYLASRFKCVSWGLSFEGTVGR